MAKIELIPFSLKSFGEVRLLQESLAKQRANGEIPDTILYGEHPPTLALGLRTKLDDPRLEPTRWASMGVEVVSADRGGEATYHCPGQLIIYPVVSLRGRAFGVKTFVEKGLKAITDTLGDYGLEASPSLCPAGVWVKGRADKTKKIAAVGLRFKDGVSLHGFSLNVNCDLKPFSLFAPCGIESGQVTSMKQMGELGGGAMEAVAARVLRHFRLALQ